MTFNWLNNGQSALASYDFNGSPATHVLEWGEYYPSSFDRDGRLLAVRVSDAIRQGVVRVNEKEGSAAVETLMESDGAERGPEVSPDGCWLAYESKLRGGDYRSYQVWVRPYHEPGGPVPVSFDGGQNPAWNPKGGRELFFTQCHQAPQKCRMMVVNFTPGNPPHVSPARPLFEFEARDLPSFCGAMRGYDVAPDGQRFYSVQVTAPPPKPPVTYITLIENWVEEWKATVK